MSPVSRGFRHLHRAPAGQEDRVPPGQYVTDGFPVLSAGPTPHTPLEQWTFSITQGGRTRKSWTWPEFRALPAETVTADIHCVTRWSKLGTQWQGVSVDTLLGQVEHDAPYVMSFCDGGYTANLPIQDITNGKAWVAFGYGGGPLGPMERTAVRGRLRWQAAAVTSVTRETASVVTIELDPPDWPGHRAGQHLDVRLTAEDGYTAEREYSIASAPGEPVAITVERIEDGEVSPYLTGDLRAGDQLDLRGPVGGYFVWEPGDGGPLMLLAGGSGVVPLRSILRHRQRSGSDVPARLVYSSRRWEDVIYRTELGQDHHGVQVSYTLTRGQPAGWTGHTGRISRALLADVAWPAQAGPLAYICGPTSFVETAAAALVDLGYPPERVKTERFGSTGGQ
jgi:ferredoxin-NADP reductase